ncbi:MAG: M23 family metallopeptidase, partial [Anaerolineaceae bacterium]|nr:M23 family metallopeptidase [Anaerolineaceae bacterium]
MTGKDTMRITQFILIFIFSITAVFLLAAEDPPQPFQATDEIEKDLSIAFSERTSHLLDQKLVAFDLFTPEIDTAFIAPDGKIAVIWLTLRDDSGRIVATEPGLALAKKIDNHWEVLLPGDPDWEETFVGLSDEMLPLEQRPSPKSVAIDNLSVTTTLTGYYLPYAAGTKQWLEGSISHFQYIPDLGYPSCLEENCRYAYDFTNTNHFPLLASKDGTVLNSRDSCSDGNPYCTNYIVIKDTNNQTYQLYLHLSYGTIPNKLTDGTFVKRGQYIGDTDDTGYSTSNHVHFMVVDSLWFDYNSQYYWGHSIDVRFADVTINSGIPRTCYEVTNFQIYDGATECNGDKSDPRNPNNDWFVSGNVGAYPPTGTLTRPVANATVASGVNPMIDVTATASDDVRVTAVRMVAKLNNQWIEIGPKVTQQVSPGTYDWDVNLCEATPMNGPLEVALRVWDHEGNVGSALNPRTIQVDHACPPPASKLNPAISYDSTATKLSWSVTSMGAGLGS